MLLSTKFVALVVFELAGQRFALPAAQVQEVVRAVAPTPLPHAPSVVEGVINVRGDLVPMLDIRQRFKLPPKPVRISDHLILARTQQLVCVRADRVTDVTSVDASMIEALDPVVSRTPYVSGVIKLPDGLVLIHDLETFLMESEAEEISNAIDAYESPSP